MRIILETLMAGPNGVFQPGEHDVDGKLGAELIKAGHAKPVVPEKASVTPPKVPARPKPETAALKPGETATTLPIV